MQDDEDPTFRDNNISLLTCAFNQDGGCLAIGTTGGFSVHNLHPTYGVSVQRELSGGVGIVEMLFRCNLMALVGGGPAPHAPPHRVLIHDDHQGRTIGDLSFRQVVLSVRLRKDAIAVALRDRVYVYQLANLALRDKIYTADNPHGLLCLSTNIKDMVLACPSVTTGHVRVELYGSRKTMLMEAHEGSLRAISLTADGKKLATASEKGTVIRVWDVTTAVRLQEFRRGVERASITCLAWSWDHAWLCCTSDKGTAHVFQLENTTADDAEEKKSASTASESITSMLFSSVRKSVEGDARKSVCQIRGVPHPSACTFVAAAVNLVAIAGWDADGNGVLMLAEFQPGHEPNRVGYHVLCKSAYRDESDEARRRRRLRGWTPEIPQTPEGGRLYVGERLEVLEKGMEQIHFEEGNDDDEFVSVWRKEPEAEPTDEKDVAKEPEEEQGEHIGEDESETQDSCSPMTEQQDEEGRNTTIDSPVTDSETHGDSLRTEPLDDEVGESSDSSS